MPIIEGMEHNSEQWVTYYRVPHPVLGDLLVQKKDGCTRTVPARSAAWRPVRVVEELLLGESCAVHADHDLVALQPA